MNSNKIFLLAILLLWFQLFGCVEDLPETPGQIVPEITVGRGYHLEAVEAAAGNLGKAEELCQKIEKPVRRDWCYSDIAEIAARTDLDKAKQLCSKASEASSKESCLFGIVINAGDSDAAYSLCDEMNNATLHINCKAVLASKTDQGEAKQLCDEISDEQDRGQCYSLIEAS